MKHQDKQALPPNLPRINNIFKEVRRRAEQSLDEATVRDIELSNLPTYKGWEVYEEIVEQWISSLQQMLDPSSGNSIISIDDDPYEIGLKFLIVSFAISQIKAILQIPKATRQGIDETEQSVKQSGE